MMNWIFFFGQEQMGWKKVTQKENENNKIHTEKENRWFGINLRFSSVFPLVFDKKKSNSFSYEFSFF